MAIQDEAKLQKIKAAFHEFDTNGNGKLFYDEILAYLRKGDPKFAEEQAKALFAAADEDLSGEIEFDEFIEFIYNDGSFKGLLYQLEKESSEEDAKVALMTKSHQVRAAVSKLVKERGENWSKMTWKQRLDEVVTYERSLSEESEIRTQKCAVKETASHYKAPIRKNPEPKRAAPLPKREEPVHKRGNAETALTSAISEGTLIRAPTSKFGIAGMDQPAIVDYSLTSDDLDFAGSDRAVLGELLEFKQYLKSAASPLETLEIEKFIAKGTAGRVFLCKGKTKKVAMKLVRMTQARSGIKEWYISKMMRELGVSNIVLTDETVFVLPKNNAPPVIANELKDAGPVPYYMALIQELMPWGTVEDLSKEGEMSPEIMFKAMEDVAETLAVMHKNKVQHRDVKPENIMLVMDEDDTVQAAKLCDFGSAMIGDDPKGCQDDVRRFGVTLFSLATGEGWTKNRLIHAKHEDLVERLTETLKDSSDTTLKKLPGLLEKILSGTMQMEQIVPIIAEMSDAYDDD